MFLKKGKLVCFIGIDGSGKSTLSKMLYEHLKKRNIKCKHVYGRLLPKLTKPIFIIAQKIFLKKSKSNYKLYSKTKQDIIKKHGFLSKIYTYLLLFEYFWLILFKIRIPLALGYMIVCDRYVYDTVINDFPVTTYREKCIVSWINKIFEFAPYPDITFLVDVPEDVAMNRKDDIPDIEYVKEKRNLYNNLIHKSFRNIKLIDGTLKKNEIFRTILKEVDYE